MSLERRQILSIVASEKWGNIGVMMLPTSASQKADIILVYGLICILGRTNPSKLVTHTDKDS